MEVISNVGLVVFCFVLFSGIQVLFLSSAASLLALIRAVETTEHGDRLEVSRRATVRQLNQVREWRFSEMEKLTVCSLIGAGLFLLGFLIMYWKVSGEGDKIKIAVWETRSWDCVFLGLVVIGYGLLPIR